MVIWKRKVLGVLAGVLSWARVPMWFGIFLFCLLIFPVFTVLELAGALTGWVSKAWFRAGLGWRGLVRGGF